jgi:flavin-dependent dehydrogenase
LALSSQLSSVEAIAHPALIQDSPELPIVRAERLRLRNWLATNLPIQWGKRVMRIEHDDEGVSVDFEDGTTAKGDILVGADGINSIGRSLTPDVFSGNWLRDP